MTLYQSLVEDLLAVGIDVESMTLVVRPFHSRYHGRYLFDKRKAYVYAYEDKGCTRPRHYCDVLETAIHEGVHHMMNLAGVNAKGQAHGDEFCNACDHYMLAAKKMGLSDKTFVNLDEVRKGS